MAPFSSSPPPERRRSARCSISVPVEITVLRSGVPQTIHGRSLDIGELGLGLMVAGELHAGDSVAVKFHLPGAPLTLHARARARHVEHLHGGLEFEGLSADLRNTIARWSKRLPPAKSDGERLQASKISTSQSQGAETLDTTPPGDSAKPPSPAGDATRSRKPKWIFLATAIAMLMACAGSAAWWHWQQGWKELEAPLAREMSASDDPVSVSADEMEKRVIHRVRPIIPGAYRRSGRESEATESVLVKFVIGRDGRVLQATPVNGAEALIPAAVESAKWWQFQPYLVEGEAKMVQSIMTVEFRE